MAYVSGYRRFGRSRGREFDWNDDTLYFVRNRSESLRPLDCQKSVLTALAKHPTHLITELYSELIRHWLKADVHGTMLSHATSLRHAYDTFVGHDCRKVLRRVLKSYNLFRVVRRLHATKSALKHVFRKPNTSPIHTNTSYFAAKQVKFSRYSRNLGSQV